VDLDDLAEIGKILSYLAPVIILILVNVFFRKQQKAKRQQEEVRSLLSEINYNQKLMEAFLFQRQAKKFKAGSWKRNRDKMDYIDQDLHTTMASAYEIAGEFNREIEAAKKHKSTSYLAGIQVDRLREPLAKSRQGLEEWLQLNKGKKESVKPGDDLAP
jgi:hypothetical protein